MIRRELYLFLFSFILFQASTTEPDYAEESILGWKVFFASDLVTHHPEEKQQAEVLLQNKLFEITRILPEEKIHTLRTIEIWVDWEHERFPCMVYHPSEPWLQENGCDVRMAKKVHIANVKNFLAWTKDQPWMVMHELAHAYHHQVLGYDHPGIRQCYRQACEGKSYESVLHIHGQHVKAYALNNDQEYFAELTEAFLGTNDMYPFVRAEVKEFDPDMFDLLTKIWIES